jgi:branched-chain amino acid transport system substrate-binding protein
MRDKEGTTMIKSEKKKMTRRQFLKNSGKSAAVIGGALAFPEIIRSTGHAAEDTIKIGTMFAISGPYATNGTDRTEGAQFAAEQINAKGGLLGKKVEVIVRDEQANAGVAAIRAKELVEKEKIKFLIGGTSSATIPAMKDQTAPNGVLMMVCCMADAITTPQGFDKTIFHIYPQTWMAANTMGRFAAKNLGTKWYFLVADYVWGWDNYNSYTAVLNEFKGTNLGMSSHPLGATDFSPYITKILAAKPDVLITVSAGRDQVNSWKQLREFGAFEKIKVCGTVLYFSNVLGVGVDAFWGGYGQSPFYWEDEQESTRKFVEAFSKRYNRPPSCDTATTYEGTMEFFSAVQRTESLDPNKIIDAMEGHKFQWARGPQYWRKCDHQSIQDLYVVTPKKPQKKYDIFQIAGKMEADAIVKSCKDQGFKE